MRCINCGWENPSNLQRCEKCNSPLSPAQDLQPSHNASAPIEQILRGTISEQQVFSDSPAQGACPKCGFPLRQGSNICPQCGETINRNPISVHASPDATPMATINPFAQAAIQQEVKSFSLEPIAYEGERNVPTSQKYLGASTELNRSNTDQFNNAITSKVQAVISCDEDGNWTIEDKSAQGTTFVQATRQIKLQSGDIIMLGNRKFIFKAE